MKNKLIRLAFGSLVIALIVAIIYGWMFIHTALGLTSVFYLGVVVLFIGYFMAYAIGDIAMAAYESYKSK